MDNNGSLAFYKDDNKIAIDNKKENFKAFVIMGGVYNNEPVMTLGKTYFLNRFKSSTMNQFYSPQRTFDFLNMIINNVNCENYIVSNNLINKSFTWNNINYFKFSLNSTSNNLELSNSNGTFLTCNSHGKIGIGTSTSNAPLTLASGHLICTDNGGNYNVGNYIGLNSGNSDNIDDGNAKLVLNGSGGGASSGNVNVYVGSTGGSFNILNGSSGNVVFNVNNNGVININNSTDSTIDNASMILKGGITIQSTSNSSSITSGGCMTVMGGTSIITDLYVGGKVFIEGELNASGAVSQPTIIFSNTENCNIIETGNMNLMRFSSQGILVFYINVNPTVSREYCSFRFDLPDRVSNLINRGECVINVSGWSNDTQVIPLCNVIGVGISGTKSGLIKFTSINTDIHYLTVQCIPALGALVWGWDLPLFHL